MLHTLYSTTRVDLYDVLKSKWSEFGNDSLPLHRKILAGYIVGGFGTTAGNPADVAGR